MSEVDAPEAPGAESPAAAPPTAPRHVAIEGVIGVGKTTLARRLAQQLGGRLVEEVVDENPFLARFYRDRRAHAFQTQIYFLLSRFQQHQEFLQPDLFRRSTVADYLFDKDRVFAHLNLDEQELTLYERIFSMLSEQVPAPDLVIYLQASTDVLMQRIRTRGRPFERAMPRDYVEDLNQAYNRFFFGYDRSPLLVVNTNDLDFAHGEEDVAQLTRFLVEPPRGVQYYVPQR